jgi:hypothetical protein
MRNWRPLIVTLTCGMPFLVPRSSAAPCVKQRANGAEHGIDPFGNFAVHVVQGLRAGDGGIEFACEPRTIGAERMQLNREA